jgi:hypothetical protein
VNWLSRLARNMKDSQNTCHRLRYVCFYSWPKCHIIGLTSIKPNLIHRRFVTLISPVGIPSVSMVLSHGFSVTSNFVCMENSEMMVEWILLPAPICKSRCRDWIVVTPCPGRGLGDIDTRQSHNSWLGCAPLMYYHWQELQCNQL